MTTAGNAELNAAPRTHRSIPDRLLGGAGVAMMILALVVLILGGEGDDGASPVAAPPVIGLVEPAAGTEITEPLAVVFTVPEELVQQPSGWGVGGHHLHLQLDALELMPAAADIEQLPSGHYRWQVGKLEAGPHTVRLFWSDAQHQPISEGGSEPITIQAK